MPDALISVKNLSKTFQTKRVGEGLTGALKGLFHRETIQTVAVDDISFEIAEGEFIGYIGANGAGKSTTIKMLTGILLPSSGTIEVAGFVPFRERRAYVRNIGVVFGQRTQLWWDLAVTESFRLLGKIYEIPTQEYKRRIETLTELLDLREFLNTPVRKLSLGQRMRCDLAASLLHKPRVLFLDEPTIGLDVLGKAKIREFLKELNATERVTILLTTHDLDDIEQLCRRIIVIDQGRKVFDGELERLLLESAPLKRLVVEFDGEPVEGAFGDLANIAFRRLDSLQGEFTFDRTRMSSVDVIQQVMTRHSVRDIRIEEPGIEDVVKDLYANSRAMSARSRVSGS